MADFQCDSYELIFEIKKDIEPTYNGVKGDKHRQGPSISSMSNDIITKKAKLSIAKKSSIQAKRNRQRLFCR